MRLLDRLFSGLSMAGWHQHRSLEAVFDRATFPKPACWANQQKSAQPGPGDIIRRQDRTGNCETIEYGPILVTRP